MLVYVNGDLVPAEKATVSVLDHGFLYGVGLFETIRVYNTRMFLWERHYARLQAGLFALRIACPWTERQLAEAVRQTAEANGLRDAYVRISVTGGAEGVGLMGGSYERPCLFIFAKPVAPIVEPPVAKRLVTVSVARQTAEGRIRFKSHNYLNNTLAKQEIGTKADVEGLFLTPQGDVAEGVVSNVFWVRDGNLYTPSPETGILAGITRGFVRELARELGIPCEEGRYPLSALLAAGEVFVTNSIQEIVPVCRVDETTLPVTDGPVTRALRQAYRRSVEKTG